MLFLDFKTIIGVKGVVFCLRVSLIRRTGSSISTVHHPDPKLRSVRPGFRRVRGSFSPTHRILSLYCVSSPGNRSLSQDCVFLGVWMGGGRRVPSDPPRKKEGL